MPVVIHSGEEQRALWRAGQVAAATLAAVAKILRPGISTADIDRFVRKDTAERGARPSQLGYNGFPCVVCTSINEVVCHGIPSAKDVLKEGDIVNVDVTSEVDGFHGDTSATFAIGRIDPDKMRVLEVSRRALAAGIAVVRDGARLGDIGAVIEELAKKENCGVVREYGGHGIGRSMHMDPHVPHVGQRGRGLRLRAGMALTIEPMITIGEPQLIIAPDGWTVYTRDRSPSAQFEHTIVVARDGCEVTTRLND
jgi:methionyl aminopeptidase